MKIKHLPTCRVMRFSLSILIIQFLLISFLNASGLSGQTVRSVREVFIDLKAENKSVSEIFQSIEGRTDYKFNINWPDVDSDLLLSMEYKDASIADILLDVSKETGLTFKQINNSISVLKASSNDHMLEVLIEEDIPITGKVTESDSGEGLPGVNVLVKGTNKGTVTDVDGNFQLDIPDTGVTLVFSSVGFVNQEVVVNDETKINISLDPDITSLDEIVVVGYGTQKKVNLTGAVAVVKGDDIINRPAIGTTDALQGFMPGVTVTKSSGSPGDEEFNIQIRGVTSVNNNPVLVLVDGIEGALEDVRPEDIESISVLKDASAASIYGAKAAGGVIMVTTKGGKKGEIQVQYNSYYSFSKVARLPERLNSYEIADALNVATVNAGGTAPVSQEIIDKLADPNTLYEVNPTNPEEWLYYGNYNDVELALKDVTPLQSHNIAISGGSENTTYRLSGTYFRNDGILKIGYDQNEKYTGRLNIESKINKYLTFSNNLSYSRNMIEKPAGTGRNTQNGNGLEARNDLFSDIYQSPGVSPLYDPNGYYTYGARIGGFDGRNRLLDHIYDVGKDERDQNNLRINAKLSIENLVDGLRFRFVGVTDANFDNSIIHEKPVYQHKVDGSEIETPVISHNSIYKDQNKSVFKEFQFLADYNKSLGDHNIYVLGGYSFQEFRRDFFSAEAQGLINKNLADFNWASNEGIGLGDAVASNAFQSVFGRLTYNFKERYLIEGNVRYDGSSKLVPHNRYRLFPSASFGWRMSEESWFNVAFISELKLRGSTGQLGNAGVLGNYDFISLLRVQDGLILSNSDQRAQYIYQDALASENLTWETIKTSNIGIDLGLFDNRLNLTGDYYVKRNNEMIAPVTYPSVLGVDLNDLNAGELKTWGWDFNATWRQENVRGFSYWVSANLSDNQNKLVEYLGADLVREGTRAYLQGLPINTIWGYKTDGLFQSQDEVDNHAFQSGKTGPGDLKYVDLNGDGNINRGDQTMEDHGDLVNLGNTNPRYNFGIQSGFNWKGVDFMIFLQGVGKRTALMDIFAVMPFYRPWLNPQRHHLDYWSPENPDAFWPRLYARGEHNYQPSDKWVQNAAYVRIKDIQIGYTLPNSVINKIGVERLRFYIAGRDVWEFTKTFDFIDPETPDGATFMYPFKRKYTIGVNLTF